MTVPKNHEIDARLVDARLAIALDLDQEAQLELMRGCYLRGYGDGLEQALTETAVEGSILGLVQPRDEQ